MFIPIILNSKNIVKIVFLMFTISYSYLKVTSHFEATKYNRKNVIK